MRLDKARELYSDYLEGTLDKALKASFESELKRDPSIKADFESFKTFYSELPELLDVKAPVMLGLEDQIKQKLDLSAWESKRKNSGRWFSQFRLGLAGALSLAVIAVAYISFNKFTNGPSMSGILPSGGAPQLFTMKDGKYIFSLPSDPSSQVTFTMSDLQGEGSSSITSSRGSSLSQTPIENNGKLARAVEIDISGTDQKYILAMPGSTPHPQMHGNGTVAEMALAIANTFHTPVVVIDIDSTAQISWNFSGTDARQNAMAAVQSMGWSVDRQNQFIRIEKH